MLSWRKKSEFNKKGGIRLSHVSCEAISLQLISITKPNLSDFVISDFVMIVTSLSRSDFSN